MPIGIGIGISPSLLEYAFISGILSQGLISYWQYEANRLTIDEEGNNPLVNTGGVLSVPGLVGNAASFNGSGQNLATGSISTLADFSLAFWYNPDVSTDQFILGMTNAIPSGIVIEQSSGSIDINWYNTIGILQGTITLPVTINDWQFIVITLDIGNNLSVYLNGVLFSTIPTNVGDNGGNFVIGDFSTLNPLSGLIDQTAYWAIEISPLEVDWLYNCGNGRTYNETISATAIIAPCCSPFDIGFNLGFEICI